MSTYWLSHHVGYACRRAGACCTSDWPIPVESVQVPAIARATGERRLEAPVTWLTRVDGQPADVAGVLARSNGRCVFYGAGGAGGAGPSCSIHAVLGHDALPSSCRHFPRRCLIDGRGVFVTLSHYCPTAVSLLFSHAGPLEIVEGPAVGGGSPEGLDARGVLPPLLTEGVLMDADGQSAWEAHVISRLADTGNPHAACSPDVAVAAIARDAVDLTSWRPGTRCLREAVCELRAGRAELPHTRGPLWALERDLFDRARHAVPDPQRWPRFPQNAEAIWPAMEQGWNDWSPVIGRLLAAHAFASWAIYSRDGLMAQITSIRQALAVLRAEACRICIAERDALTEAHLTLAIRQTDLLLRHLVLTP